MNRRDALKAFRNFCILNGISGILSPELFAQTMPTKKRFVAFVIKYTGGTTKYDGTGHWNFNETLSPLAPYKNDICIPLGLNCKFTNNLNTHAAPQVSALTGSSTGTIYRPADRDVFPVGNLANYTTGNGKSIDVLIGEKLQALYKTQIPTLQITNYKAKEEPCNFERSSFGANGVLLPVYTTVNDLSQELKSRILCNAPTTNDSAALARINRKLAALDIVKSSSNIFNSNYIIDKEKLDDLQSKLDKSKNTLKISTSSTGSVRPLVCDRFPTMADTNSYKDPLTIGPKLNAMFDLVVGALQANVTRSVVINIYRGDEHATYSHHGGYRDVPVIQGKYDMYVKTAQWMQQQIANFIAKLKAAGLYDDTLMFCNAGSCMSFQVHNYENISNYIINGDKSGVVSNVENKKPIGSLLLDILHKFDIKYDRYGGTNLVLGEARKGNYI